MAKLKSGTGTTKAVKKSLVATTTATAPDGTQGDLYYDSDKDALMAYGSSWEVLRQEGSASGGTETAYSGYKVHTFLADAQFVVSGGNLDADVLVVGGGGCGGRQHGGGGGAGGVIVHSGYLFASGTYTIDVGAGGAADTATYSDVAGITGHSGSDTTVGSTYTAKGGGGGAGWAPNQHGADGGSGGGGSSSTLTDGDSTQSSAGVGGGTHYGNDGGPNSGNPRGAGGVGQTYACSRAGDGGVGIQNAYRTGSQVWYGGGGGGAGHGTPNTGGQGGSGGGGAGGTYTSPEPGSGRGTDGQANTGGGGGAGSANDVGHGGGGSGIVVIRYVT